MPWNCLQLRGSNGVTIVRRKQFTIAAGTPPTAPLSVNKSIGPASTNAFVVVRKPLNYIRARKLCPVDFSHLLCFRGVQVPFAVATVNLTRGVPRAIHTYYFLLSLNMYLETPLCS